MCGHVGLFGTTLGDKEEKIFKQLLMADVVRGKDGTGVISSDGKSSTWFKQAVTAPEMISSSDFVDWMKDMPRKKLLAGHNRAATLGGVSTDTTHPFSVGGDRITLLHNGTLYNHEELNPTAEVDSFAIATSMLEKGVKDTVDSMCGAWALVWIDAFDNTINFCRNADRPLYMGQIKKALPKETVWIYGSEEGMLEWICERNNATLEELERVPTHTLLSFDLDGDFKKPKTKKLTHKEDDSWGSIMWPRAWNKSSYSGTTTPSGNKESESKKEVVQFAPLEFKPHQKQYCEITEVRGSLYGVMLEDPYAEVVVYDTIIDRCYITCELPQQNKMYIDMDDMQATVVSKGKRKGTGEPLWGLSNKTLETATKEEYLLEGPEGEMIPWNDWLDATSSGCSHCGQEIQVSDDIIWAGEQPICGDCVEDMTEKGVA